MKSIIRIAAVAAVAAALLRPVPAAAQPAWDLTGTAGLFNGRTDLSGEARYGDDWLQVAQAGLVVGRYLTPHVKVELDATLTGTGRQYIDRFVQVPGFGAPYPVSAEAERSRRSLAVALAWQFGDNDWVHPFVRVGASVNFDRERIRTWDQFFYSDPRLGQPPLRLATAGTTEAETTVRPMALVGGGAKFYLSPRAFVRTDADLTLGQGRQSIAFRLGVGVDF